MTAAHTPHQISHAHHTRQRNQCQQAYVVGCDGAGGVAGDKLELHVDLAEEVLVLGLKPGAGDLVQPQRQELPIIQDLAAAVTPGDVELLVEARRRNGTRGQQDS
jgi:hypothetical protein